MVLDLDVAFGDAELLGGKLLVILLRQPSSSGTDLNALLDPLREGLLQGVNVGLEPGIIQDTLTGGFQLGFHHAGQIALCSDKLIRIRRIAVSKTRLDELRRDVLCRAVGEGSHQLRVDHAIAVKAVLLQS